MAVSLYSFDDYFALLERDSVLYEIAKYAYSFAISFDPEEFLSMDTYDLLDYTGCYVDEVLDAAVDEDEVRFVLMKTAELSDHIEYYYDRESREDYIELSCNHTMYSLNSSDEWDAHYDNFYLSLVDTACDSFEDLTGVTCYLLGRSSRHVCVEDTFENALNYEKLCDVAHDLECEVIEEFNSNI